MKLSVVTPLWQDRPAAENLDVALTLGPLAVSVRSPMTMAMRKRLAQAYLSVQKFTLLLHSGKVS